MIARQIVATIQQRGGRFLQRVGHTGDEWEEVTNKRAQQKTSQALREGLDVRHKVSYVLSEIASSARSCSSHTSASE
jgi:hypothetical protein